MIPNSALHLVLRERRGRLVHDHHARVERHRASDLHELDLGDRQVTGLGIRVELDPDLAEQPSGVAPHPVVVHEARTRPRGKRPSQMFSMTVRAGTGWSSCWIIEMPARSRPGVAKRPASPASSTSPASGWHEPGEDVHERGLAGAVLAAQGVDGAGRER